MEPIKKIYLNYTLQHQFEVLSARSISIASERRIISARFIRSAMP
jgi:hypothetical protein